MPLDLLAIRHCALEISAMHSMASAWQVVSMKIWKSLSCGRLFVRWKTLSAPAAHNGSSPRRVRMVNLWSLGRAAKLTGKKLQRGSLSSSKFDSWRQNSGTMSPPIPPLMICRTFKLRRPVRGSIWPRLACSTDFINLTVKEHSRFTAFTLDQE